MSNNKLTLLPHLLIAALSCIDLIIFSIAVRFVDIATASIFYDSWPIIMIFWLSILLRGNKRYTETSLIFYVSLLLAFIGFAFVTASESENFFANIADEKHIIAGISLALLAGAIGAIGTSHSIRYCENLHKNLSKYKISQSYCVLIYLLISRPIASVIAGIGMIAYEEPYSSDIVLYGIAFGIVVFLPTILFRVANLKTNNLGINALVYTTPIFALIWLALADIVKLPSPDLLIIGAAAIITANLLLNFEASLSIAYKALIIALWACGTVVYLGEGFLLPDYASKVAIFATLFILILSFRLDRLVRRATKEEDIALQLLHKISRFAKLNKIKKDDAENAQKALLAIDSHKTPDELHCAYNELKRCLNTPASPDADAAPLQEGNAREYNLSPLDELGADIDMLTHSKQQGMNFGELTALAFIGIILIFSLLFFQPLDTAGWNGFFTEMSAFILASVVLFLFFNILDLQRDRHRPILKEDTDTSTFSFSIVFRDATNRGFEQWVSVIVCTTIILAYGWLFWGKWLGMALN